MPYADKKVQREYQKQWTAKRRADFFANKQCKRCGSTNRLELDHMDPSKKVSHKIWSWSEAKMKAELEKCQVLCYDCHKSKTKVERTVIRSHGTPGMYSKGHCRCQECKNAWAKYNRQVRARK